MVKIHNKTIGAIIVLMMLTTSSLTINYAYADNSENNIGENAKSTNQKAILTEKMIDGKLEVKRFAVSEELSDSDMNRMLSFEDAISSWAYINYKTFQSGIVLYDGKASKVGENHWKVSTNGSLELDGNVLDLELSGKSEGIHVEMHGTATNDELSYRVIFTGKMAETNQDDVFVIALMSIDLKNHEEQQNFKLLDFGYEEFHIENPTISEYSKSVG